MIAIASYNAEDYGINLPEAVIEVRDVQTSKLNNYYQSTNPDGSPDLRNTIVRFRVWVDQAAFQAGKRPIVEGEKFVNLSPSQHNEIANMALAAAFPDSEIISE